MPVVDIVSIPLIIYEGDDLYEEFLGIIFGDNSKPVNIQSGTLQFIFEGSSGVDVFTIEDSEITKFNDGSFIIKKSRTDLATIGLVAGSKLVYQVKFTDAANRKRTVLKGTLEVEATV